MKSVFQIGILLMLITFVSNCKGQVYSNDSVKSNLVVGGGCDGCELMFEEMPSEIKSEVYSPNWNETGQKILVKGRVYKLDGKTVAPNVIIYFWQTDVNGSYTKGEGKSKRHGYIRGWVKSDEQGKYSIYTRRPGAYPSLDMPAHIHVAIKEPKIEEEYYIDAFVFDDDALLTEVKRKELENRGGNGVLKFLTSDGLLIAEHNIILGLNIPNYPE